MSSEEITLVNWESSVNGPGGMATLMDRHDWSKSVLGDPATWPFALHAVVRLMLSSKFPMFVAWGPELGFLYNDAYAEILGNKHPQALGGRFQDIWGEIWQDISPIIDTALRGESSYFENLPLIVQRAGLPEQAWFTFSYSPAHNDQGAIAGMFCSVIETTRSVQNNRLRDFQLCLADALHTLTSPNEIVSTALTMLAGHLGASRAWYAEIDQGNGRFYTKTGKFDVSLPALPGEGIVDEFYPALLESLRVGREFICNDVDSDARLQQVVERYRAIGIAAILTIPILKDERLAYTINVAKSVKHPWSEEDLRAAREVADRTWVALENVLFQFKLKSERDKGERILGQMGEGFMVIGTGGNVAKINAEGLRLLRRDEAEVLGIDYRLLLPEDDRSSVATALESVVRTGLSSTLEIKLALHPVEPVILEMRLSGLQDEGVAVFLRDVTAERQSALALRRSEEHLSALFEQTAAGIAERDLDGRLIRVNERLCQILGRSREQVLGVNIHDLTFHEDLERSVAAFGKLLADGQPFTIEKRYVRPDGSLVWVSTTVSFIRNVGSQPSNSVLAVIVDIAERKRAEEALQEETRILELQNQATKELAETLDLTTLLQTVTDSGRSLIGAQYGAFFYNSRDERGDSFMLYSLSGAPKSAFESLGHPRATQIFKPTFTGEAVIRSDDITQDPRYGKMAPHFGMPKGHPPVRSYLAASVVSRSGEVLGGLFFGHARAGAFTRRSERLIIGLAAQAALAIDNARLYDLAQKALNERESLLESERAARSEAERLNTYKDEFLAMLAHELRNPLSPISAAAAVLRMSSNDANSVRQVSEIISRQIGHLTRLIDDLMDVSRVRRGLILLQCEAIDLKSIIAAAVEQVRPMIEARKHSLTTRLQADNAIVYGDRTRLVQVIANLLTNSAKYTPQNGEILLRVEADGEYARVTVIDNGNGIDASLLPHVFDLFTQGTRELDRSQGGLGIGLSLVKTIVQLHNGAVEAFSEGSGKGSMFTVSLPLMREESSRSLDNDGVLEVTSNLSILVVDDNLDAANATAILLKAVGHQVTVATSAQAALGEAALRRFDVFILDLGLPEMSGYQLVKALRQDSRLRNAAFFALTGYGQPQDRQQSVAAGFSEHFVKPLNNQLLFKALLDVRRVLNQHSDVL